MRSNASGRSACWVIAAVCVPLVTPLAGCSGSNARRMEADLYQRELRLQEDEIYRLEDYLEEYQAIVRGYRCEVAELRQELNDRDRPGIAAHESASRPLEAAVAPTPATESSTPPAPDDLIEMPPGDEAPSFTPPAASAEASEAPAFEPAPLFQPDAEPLPAPTDGAARGEPEASAVKLAAVEGPPAELAEDSPSPPLPFAPTPGRPIAVQEDAPVVPGAPIRLTLERPAGGPHTLAVVVTEAEDGWLAGFRGEASLMLTDPGASGKRRRLARWDFTSEEVEASRDVPPDGPPQLTLTISLPIREVIEADARVWVRLVDESGVKTLQAAPLVTRDARPIASAGDRGHRLPRVDRGAEGDATLTQAAAHEDPSINRPGWRRAVRGRRPRRLDPAVAAAAHFIEIDAASPAGE
ncbi:MAG: hypothetical protein AAF805_11560 [Planctomycetota bacterium]